MGKRFDLTGQRFERLLVVEKTSLRKKNGAVIWECVCDCGKKHCVGACELKRGTTKSCGCLLKDFLVELGQKSRKDLSGRRFGRLVAQTSRSKNKRRWWHCKCDCGGSCWVVTSNLLRGLTKSCGCIVREFAQSYEGAKRIAKAGIVSSTCLNAVDIPERIVDVQAARIQLNREIRRIEDEKH